MSKKTDTTTVAMSAARIGYEAPMIVTEVTEQCLYTGFFGRLDSSRMKAITDTILDAIDATDNQVIIIDLSNVDLIDSAVAAHLMRVGSTIKLVGVDVVFCGIKSEVAQTMVTSGVQFDQYTVVRDFKTAIKHVLRLQGLAITPIASS